MRRLLLAGAVVIGMLGLVGTAAADMQRFESTGGEQSFFVPDGVTEVSVEAIGGKGGASTDGGIFDTVAVPGGFGAVARATLSVTPGQRLFVSVGGNGGDGHEAPGAGGFNGGGVGGVGSGDPAFTFGAGGGGASDVRTNSRNDPLGGLRLIVAGGGGGAGNGLIDGAGAGGSAGSTGGDGGDANGACTAAQGGAPGGSASPGQGGAGASFPGGTGGAGGNGNLGVGGQGGSEFYPGGGGGGGGGGLFGGGGGGGGAGVYLGTPICSPGGGGGGSSGFAPGATDTSVAIDQTGIPSVTFTWTRSGGNAGPGPSPTKPVELTGLSLTNKAFRVGPRPRGASRQIRSGTEFLFTLSADARVSFAIERREQTSCGPRGKRKCVRFRAITTFAQDGAGGANRVGFSGRFGKRKLSPGRYQAILSATDSAGSRTAPQQIGFQVVAP